MNCPNCGARTVIYNSRQGPEDAIRRARKCPRCRLRLTTYERIADQEFGPRKAGRKPTKTTTNKLAMMAD